VGILAYIDGTAGGTDGTAVSIDGSGSAPIPVYALNEASVAMLRCATGTATPDAVVVTAPDRYEVSPDGTAWASTANLGVVAAVNVPLYIRQTALLLSGSASHVALHIDYAGPLTDSIAPTMTTAPTATPGIAKVTYSGHAGSDNVSVAKFQFYGSTSSTAPTSGTTPTIDNLTSASFDWTGRADNTAYYGWVRAVDAAGNASAWSASGAVTTAPAQVSGVVATPGIGSVSLAWTLGGMSTFRIKRSTTSNMSGATTLTSSATSSPYLDTGRADNTTYYYTVEASNGTWGTASATASALTAPAQVTGLAATNGDTQSVLTWSAAGATGYLVYKNGTLLATLGNVLTYTATGLTNGTGYTFTVAATNGTVGTPSAGVTATPASAWTTRTHDTVSSTIDSTQWSTGYGFYYWSISGSQARAGQGSPAIVAALSNTPVSSAKGAIQFTHVATPDVNTALCRMGTIGSSGWADAAYVGKSGYMLVVNSNIDVTLYKNDSGGTSTSIGTAAAAVAGDVFRIECVGTSIIVYKNGTAVITVTDSTYSAAGMWGMGCYYVGGLYARFGNFTLQT